MKIIIGLGNPGKDYEKTRHNVGWQTVDFLREAWHEQDNFSHWIHNKKFQADISEGTLNNEKVLLVKPLTFMNNSGASAQALWHFYKIAPLDLIVIHDELDLPLGYYKIQKNVSSAGHNGIKSIIERIKTQAFHRVRIGISKEDKKKNGPDFVLKRFNLLERMKLKEIQEKITHEIEKIIT